METAEFVGHFEQTFPDLVGRSVMVALSGGRDSVALLHLLRAPELGLRLEAAHVHHDLRGTEADGDADFCRRLCMSLEIPFVVIHLPDDDERPATGEAAWRRRRYRGLLAHAAARGIKTIATGHHRDDVAEGILLQILRGAGPRAMAGIATETPEGIIRPLLPWDRGEINRWLEDRGIEWRDDSSNLATDRLRNHVRHAVLPELEAASPRLRHHLVNLAAAIAESEDFMAAEVAKRTAFADPWDPDGGVDIRGLRDLPRALRTRWLHGQMHRLGIRRTTRRQLELFHSMLDDGSPRSVTMGGRWRLRTARGQIWAEPPIDPPGAEEILEASRPIAFGVPGWTVRITTETHLHSAARWRWRPAPTEAVISLRPARTGDRLVTPAGPSRDVRKILAETLPRHLRSAWPVFCEDDMIRWIPGVWQHPEHEDPSNQVVEVIRQ